MVHTKLIKKSAERVGEILKEGGSKFKTYFVFGLQHTEIFYNHRKYIVIEQHETINKKQQIMIVYNNLIIK